MKKTVGVLLITSFASAFAGNVLKINNNDILTKNFLQYDVDGIEMWNIHPEEQESALVAFKNKCEREIPERFNIRLAELNLISEDFQMATSIETKTYRRVGDHHICRTTVNINPDSNYVFDFDYSKIYRKLFRKDVYEDCKGLVSELDKNVQELTLFDRRAYFDSLIPKEGDIDYLRCQVLAIKIQRK
jgi:hypothetical protein